MYYVVQNNIFSERNYNKIYDVLERLDLPHEVVDVIPFTDDINVVSDRQDVFVFGGTKMARIAKNYNWEPGSLLNDNHNYEIYSKWYKDNLLNFDSVVHSMSEENLPWATTELKFIRPILDNKMFTGAVFDYYEWEATRKSLINNNAESIKQYIQVASPKKIQKEFRFFIVGGGIITGSQYTSNGIYYTSPIIDEGALSFAKEMIAIYSIADCFVMDVAQTANGYKIVECGCINCAGFYESDVAKLVMAIDDFYTYKN